MLVEVFEKSYMKPYFADANKIFNMLLNAVVLDLVSGIATSSLLTDTIG